MSGLFSGETIITVQANTVQLVADEDIPNTITNSTMESVLTPRDIPLNILDDLILGVNDKTQSYYRYGKRFYEYGLPSGNLTISGVDNKAIKNHVEAFEGQPVEILRVDIDHETGQMQLASWLIATYNLNPVTLLIDSYPTEVTDLFNTMTSESEANYSLIIEDYKNLLIDEFSECDGTTSSESGNTTTTVSKEVIINESLETNEVRSAYIGDLNLTSNPSYRSVRLNNFMRDGGQRTATYDYDVWFILESTFATTFEIICRETTTTTTSTYNEDHTYTENSDGTFTANNDGTYTVTTDTQVNDITHNRDHIYTYEDTGIWIGSKIENWTVTFIIERDDDGRITIVESTNTQFGIYYSINNGTRNKFITRNYGQYRDQFISESSSEIGGSYYPIVPIRKDNQDLTHTTVKESNAYITSRRLMKRLGVSLNDIADAINENPNVGDIDHAYFVMGIPVNGTDKVVARYLFEFFNIIYGVRQDTPTPISSLGGLVSTRWRRGYTGNIFSIADTGLRIEIGFGSISKTSVLGNIGPIGFSTITHEASKTSIQGEFGVVNTTYDGTLTVRKQTEINTYEEIQVTKLNYKNYVYQNHTVDVTYYDAIHGEDENFIIPLFEPAIKKMSLIQRDRLLYMAPHLVLNSYEKTKVKWYQTDFFGFILQVIALAIAIKTGGLTGFTVGMTASAVAIMIIKKILISIIFNFAFKLVAKALGEEFALLLALALAAYGMMGKGTGMTFDIPNSELIMQASTSLILGVSSNIQDDIKNIMDSAAKFADDMTNKLDELESINKDMDPSNSINPWVFMESMQPYTKWGESPDDYFQRTVHSGNPGIKSIDIVTEYVDIMLRLPELPDTIVDSNDDKDEEPEYEPE